MGKRKTTAERKIHADEADRARAQCDTMLNTILDDCNNSNREVFRRYISSYKIAGASLFTIRNHLFSLILLGQSYTNCGDAPLVYI